MEAHMANHTTLNTAFLLMAQYNGKAVIPVEDVCRDYFSHLDVGKFIRKVNEGNLKIPMVRMEDSLKCAKGIHLQDLADYLDERRAEAKKELKQVFG
jgi:Pyocin activator protein PrtN